MSTPKIIPIEGIPPENQNPGENPELNRVPPNTTGEWTFLEKMSPEQKEVLRSYATNPTIQQYNPGYVAELVQGIQSGKYSYEDAYDAFRTLAVQSGIQTGNPPGESQPIAWTGGGGGGEEGGGEGGESGGGGGGEWDSSSGYKNSYVNPLSGDIYNLAKEQLAYASRRLGEIEKARKLANMSGTLTAEERAMFDEMETSAVENLKSQVNHESQEVWDTAIADLVDRGVLQGTVGEKILGNIGSESLRMIGEGVNTIRGQKNSQMLSMIEGNKNRALQYQGMLSNEAMGLLGMGSGYSSMISTENQSAETRTLQNALGELSAKVSYAGIASNEAIAGANRELQEKIASWQNAISQQQLSNQMLGLNNQYSLGMGQLANQKYGIDTEALTRMLIANQQAGAANTASQYGLYGNLALGGAGLAMKYGPTWWKWLTSGGEGGTGGSSSLGSEWSGGFNTNTGESFWGTE